MTVSELTERALVARLQQRLPAAPGWLVHGIGDDAAVAEPARNRLEVFTVDASIDGVHFDRRFCPPDAIGHRALAVNLSDLAAMGAEPRLALLSFMLPPTLPLADFDAIVEGLAALATSHRITVAGGNLARTPGPLTLDITAIGTVKPRGALLRGSARPGDLVYVTGSLGAAAAGLDMLRANPDAPRNPCVDRYLRPEPRVRAGLLLGRNRAASACIDLSDGLADGLARIAEASGLGIAVDTAAIPVEPEARAWYEAQGTDPLDLAVRSGDDYELLFTVRPRLRGRLKAVFRHGGVPLTRIGTCTASPGVVLLAPSGEARALPAGFTHFR